MIYWSDAVQLFLSYNFSKMFSISVDLIGFDLKLKKKDYIEKENKTMGGIVLFCSVV